MVIFTSIATSLGIDIGVDRPDVLVFLSLVTLATYAIASLALLGLIRMLSGDRLRDLPFEVALACSGGPTMLAWFLAYGLRAMPEQNSGFYLAVVFVPISALAIIGVIAFVGAARSGKSSLAASAKQRSRTGWLLVFVSAIAIVFLVLLPIVKLNIILPVTANDALDYFTASRLIFEQKSLANYPFVDSHAGEGFYGYWTHPPGFVSLLAWSYFLQGHADFAGGARLTAVWHLTALLMLVATFVARRSWIGAAAAALFLLATPFFLNNAIIQHVDTTRIAIFTAALLLLVRSLEAFTLKRAVLVGVFLGLAQFVHSIGTLVLFLGVPLYLILRKTPWSLRGIARRITEVALITVVGISVVAFDQAVNYQTYGAFLKDAPAVWSLEQLNVGEHREFVRKIATPVDRLVNGLFRGFSDTNRFSQTYLAVTLLALVLLIFSWRNILPWLRARHQLQWSLSDDILALALLVGGFYGLVILSMAAGSDLIIKNGRYLATPHGLLTCLFGGMLARSLNVLKPLMARLIFGQSAGDISFLNLASKALDLLRNARPPVVVTSVGAAVLVLIASIVSLDVATSLSAKKVERYETHNINDATRRQSGAFKVTQAPNAVYRVIDHMNQLAATKAWPPDEKVLSYRKSDAAFYLDVPFMAYLDDKLTPLYSATDIDAGLDFLQDMKIGYILAPRRAEPTFYNSVLQDIVGNPRLARLVKADSGFRLFELTLPGEAAQQVIGETVLETFPERPSDRAAWVVWDSDRRPPPEFADLNPKGAIVKVSNERGFRRDNGTRTRAWSAICTTPVESKQPYASAIPAESGTYQFESEISGKGYVRVWLWRADHFEDKRQCRLSSHRTLLWEGLLRGGDRTLLEQFISLSPPTGNRAWDVLSYELVDGGEIEIRNAVIREVLPAATSDYVHVGSEQGR